MTEDSGPVGTSSVLESVSVEVPKDTQLFGSILSLFWVYFGSILSDLWKVLSDFE